MGHATLEGCDEILDNITKSTGLFPAEPLHGDSLKIGERLSLKLNTAAGLDGTGIAEPTESCT